MCDYVQINGNGISPLQSTHGIASDRAPAEASRDSDLEMDLPNLVFVLRRVRDGSGLRFYALHTGGDGGGLILKHLFDWNPAGSVSTNFVTSGSKLYLVGGLNINDEIQKWPRDVLICDLTNWRNKKKDDFKFDQGPPTLGAKPYPRLFSLDEQIYGLPGLGCFIAEDIPDPPFEVYKGGDAWEPLSPPAFTGYYKQKNCCYDIDHKLVGRKWYVIVGGWEVYTYDVDEDILMTIKTSDQEVEVDFAVKNMLSYCTWRKISREDMDDNMVVFRCNDTIDMLACDFTEKEIPDEVISQEIDEEEDEDDTDRSVSDYESIDYDLALKEDYFPDSPERIVHFDYNLPEVRAFSPFVRVTGLEEIERQVDRNRYSTNGFVAHLAGNIYCVVYFYYKEGDPSRSVLACKFEVTKQPGAEIGYKLLAKVLCSDLFPIDWNLQFQSECGDFIQIAGIDNAVVTR